MTQFDPRAVARLLAEPLPPLPAPALRKSRKCRTACLCCGEPCLSSRLSHFTVCPECEASGCDYTTPSKSCPRRMATTLNRLCETVENIPQLKLMVGGLDYQSERADDGIYDDTVIMEHYALRYRGEYNDAYQARKRSTPLVPAYPYLEPGYNTWITNDASLVLTHQIVTRRGWYYEQVQGQDPVLVLLDRDTALATYLLRASDQHFPVWGTSGYGQPMLTPLMQEVTDHLGWEWGLTELARSERVRPFLYKHLSAPVILAQVGAMRQEVLALLTIDPTQDGWDARRNGVLTLFTQVRATLKQYEASVSGKEKISPKAALALLFAQDVLGRAGGDLQELLLI